MFGDRLKLARKKAGYSLRRLSDALGGAPSAQAIGKYERGEMMPSSGVLTQMTCVLGVSLEYLLSNRVEELEATEFRRLSGTSARDRARVEAAVIDGLQRYLAIEEILELDSDAWRVPWSGNKFLGREVDGEVLAGDLRHDWKLGIDPIPNMTSLLEGPLHQGTRDVFTRRRLGPHLSCSPAASQAEGASHCRERAGNVRKAAVHSRARTCAPAD